MSSAARRKTAVMLARRPGQSRYEVRVRPRPALSIVVPVLNEEACLPELHRRLSSLDFRRELVFVDDGSRDGSFALISRLAGADATVRGIRLRHNCGSQQALLTGMRAARGDVVVTLDADLQHPPEQIPAMVDAWREGHDVVEMLRREAAPNGLARELLTPLFYGLFNRLAPTSIDPASTDFRLLDRSCVDGLSGDWVRVDVARLERPRTTLAFDVPARFAGRSKYGVRGLARVALKALWSSARPPRPAPPAPVAEEIGRGL
jgi:dolichol-phosphate mannosyltransferase